MRFESLYRISLYAMLFLAALMVNLDAEYSYAYLYPVAVAIAAAVAYVTVDRPGGRGLDRGLANLLALGAFALAVVEAGYEETLLVLACGHLLIYLTLIKMFLPKTVEDDWFLCVLGLVQVVVAGFLSQSDQVGMALLAWALAALWVLGLFHLRREALRAAATAGVAGAPAAAEAGAAGPYPGLIDRPFLAAGLRGVLATMALGGVIFLVMPRSTTLGRSVQYVSSGRHLSGFGEDVRLGQLGEILENDALVMSIELIDEESGRSAPPPPDRELLWRGVTLAAYEGGRWYRQEISPGLRFPPAAPPPGTALRQQIKMEPGDHDVLFALRPIFAYRGPRRGVLQMNRADGSLFRGDRRTAGEYEAPSFIYPGPMEYTVTSAVGVEVPQPGEAYPGGRRLERMLAIPEAMRERMRAVADPVVAGIPPEQVVRRARALEAFLRDSGRFHYTLRMDVVDPQLDPIEDFVLNRKQGHCEYFASALTMLLRAEGIPARMVNGFKGGDWNDLLQILSVRQKHAHSWVEALVGQTVAEPPAPIWLTLDGTPAAEQAEVVARVGGTWAALRWLGDTVRYVWVFYVVGFNAERQERVLYRPIKELFWFVATALVDGYQRARQALADLAGWLTDFPDLSSFFSVKGFVVSCAGMIVLAGALLLARGLWRFVAGRVRRPDPDEAARAAGVTFYRRLLQDLAGIGLDRAPAETPLQFARRAGEFLAGWGLADAALRAVPSQIVEAFYRVRFGHRQIPSELLAQLEARLDALEASLSAGRRPTPSGRSLRPV